jgi:hypothetical protein
MGGVHKKAGIIYWNSFLLTSTYAHGSLPYSQRHCCTNISVTTILPILSGTLDAAMKESLPKPMISMPMIALFGTHLEHRCIIYGRASFKVILP